MLWNIVANFVINIIFKHSSKKFQNLKYSSESTRSDFDRETFQSCEQYCVQETRNMQFLYPLMIKIIITSKLLKEIFENKRKVQ